jgi:hypothetical protein
LGFRVGVGSVSPQNRHLWAATLIVAPHIGQARVLAGSMSRFYPGGRRAGKRRPERLRPRRKSDFISP